MSPRAKLCPTASLAAGIALLHQQLPPEELPAAIAQTLRQLNQHGDRYCLWTVASNTQLLGAVLTIENPGRSFWVSAPAVLASLAPTERDDVAASLLASAIDEGRNRQMRLLQALLQPTELYWSTVLEAAGFRSVGQLIFLMRECEEVPTAPIDAAWEWIDYSPELRPRFLQVMEATYVDTLDCPELTGLRTAEDIFESHCSQGVVRADRWRLARRAGQDVGCLFLAGLTDLQAVEIAYVGLTPAGRGQNWGRQLVRHALLDAAADGARWVTLGVDARNTPALSMYYAEGFTQWDQRHAYLCLLESEAAPSL